MTSRRVFGSLDVFGLRCVHIRIPLEGCLICTKVRMPAFTLIQMDHTNRTIR